MSGAARRKAPWPLFAAELAGTAALVVIGLSVVIVDFMPGTPVASVLPSAVARRALTGFLFGTTGAALAVSPVGKVSGAHLNPAVTFAFWLKRIVPGRVALGYVAAQLVGGIAGAVPLLAWGPAGAAVGFGATVPGPGGAWEALAGELWTTACMIALLLLFVGHPRLRRVTPLLFPPLYAILVAIEAPVSGTSTNPARTLGPNLVAGALHGLWVYFAGPLAGAGIAVAVQQATWARWFEVHVAKVFHFHHDPHRVLHRRGHGAPASAG